MNYYFHAEDNAYLAHHGVLGQKWGVRRFQNEDGTRTAKGKKHEAELDAKTAAKAERKANIASAKAAYKQSKQNLKKERINYSNTIKSQGFFANYADKKKVDAAHNKSQKAYVDTVKAKADLAKAKGGEKAELRAYAKALKKTGLSGSVKDAQHNNISTKLCKDLETRKGKEYVAKVEKRVKTQLVAEIAVGSALVVGSMVVSAMLDK